MLSVQAACNAVLLSRPLHVDMKRQEGSSAFFTPSLSSSISSPPPLTTIFTPPSDCFNHLAGSIRACNGYDPNSCFLAIGSSCYPSGGAVNITNSYSHDAYVYYNYYYSPGVLPSGLESVAGRADASGVDSMTGCLKYESDTLLDLCKC